MSSAAVSAGAAVVALAKNTVGVEWSVEYLSHNRSSRRSTMATFEPKMPR